MTNQEHFRYMEHTKEVEENQEDEILLPIINPLITGTCSEIIWSEIN